MSNDNEIDKLLEKKMREMLREIYSTKEDTLIYNVSDADFEDHVIMKSYEKPVMVDFWAPWCGPCHMLSPIIERVVQSLGGKVLLAKLNVDENPVTASRYGVMGIPTVALFVKGKPVDRFVGALPEGAILKWLSKWIS